MNFRLPLKIAKFIRATFSTPETMTAQRFQESETQGKHNLRSEARLPESGGCYVLFIKQGIAKLNVIGAQVRRLREQKGWTQDQFAVKLQLAGWDTSQDSVSRLETQDRRVPDLELFVLADVLDARLEDLFPKDLRGKIKALWPLYRVKLSRGQLPPKR
jgi:DNA-binding XRE family transcriptional regulator